MAKKSKSIGLALGGGGARGAVHVGIIKALREADIPIHYVAGTSIGALVGGVYASRRLDKLEEFLVEMDIQKILSLLDAANPAKGLLNGEKVKKLLTKKFTRETIDQTSVPFTAVATDVYTGEEIHLNKGKLSEAIRASISIPGLLTAVKLDNRYLVDGGLVNPLPINVVREMGADFVIAVDLNDEVYSKRKIPTKKKQKKSFNDGWLGQFQKKIDNWQNEVDQKWEKWLKENMKGNIVDVLGGTINVMQRKITQENLESNPADILMQPKLGQVHILDFQYSQWMIDYGYKLGKKYVKEIQKQL